MKSLIFILSLFTSFNLFSQTNNVSDTTKQSLVVRNINISETNPNEQGFILYMESLSDERAFALLKSMVDGEIVYKKKD
jgi:hypothetical protein